MRKLPKKYKDHQYFQLHESVVKAHSKRSESSSNAKHIGLLLQKPISSTIFLSAFDHFKELALKGLKQFTWKRYYNKDTAVKGPNNFESSI